MTLSEALSKVKDYIEQGKAIMNEEYHHVTEPGLLIPDYISGPKSDKWFSEISIFNSRILKDHPLHEQIAAVCKNHSRSFSAHENMMGYLEAIASDDDFWNENEPKENITVMCNRKTIEQMLAEDIDRCEKYLDDPSDVNKGRQLYSEITSRYDTVIPQFGNGLYQFHAEHHFYDPDLSAKSLIHNLTVLMNKMITFQAERYPITEEHLLQIESRQKSNKVFIVHGHDNEAKQELARTLEKGGFDAIILHEQPDEGLTIIEKIEKYADVGYAVVLYTECDIGRDKNVDANQERFRARQNVVFEHGYLIGKLGRSHVTALVKGNVETPGDISGVIYTPMDAGGAWKMHLGKNMCAVGIMVDLNTFCF